MSSWLQSLSSHFEEKLAKVKANSLSTSAPTLPTAMPPVGLQASWSSSSAYSSASGSDSGSNGPATLSGMVPATAQTTPSLSTTVKTGMSTLFSLASKNAEEIGEDSEFWAPTALLTIHLVEGKDLEVADRSGTSDPYVIFRVKGGNGRMESVKSSVVPKTLNPKWNETYNLLIWKGTTELEVEVFDKDLVKDDELGSGTIELQSLTTAPFVRVSSWLQLQNVKRGSLNIALVFRPLGSGSLDEESPCNSRPRDEYGFPMSPGAVEAKKRLSKIIMRTSKEQKKNWQRIQWWRIAKEPSQIKSNVRKGIPYTLRGEVWQLLCGSKEKRLANPMVYYDLVDQFRNATSPSVSQIAKDLHRTFPGHRIFDHPQGKESLRNSLTAFAFRNQHIGYCQSMNFIIALLLLFMSEEEAFWTLDTITEKYLSDYFAASMIGLKADTTIFNNLLATQRPKLFEHLNSIGFSMDSLTTQWFLSLFVNLTPTETCLRILDCFFAEGTIALFAAAMGIIDTCEEDLLQTTDFDEAFVFLQQAALQAYDPDVILKLGFGHIGSFSLEKLACLRSEACQSLQEQQKELDFQVLQRVTRFGEDDLAKLSAHFKALHTSNLGSIDFESFQELLGFMDIRDPILLSQLFKQFDDNGDGTIEFREFICGLNLLASGTFEEKLLMVFKTFDLDSNGYLDIDEIGIMLDIQYKMLGISVRISRQRLEELMKEIDADGNGKVSFAEFKGRYRLFPLLTEWLQLISDKTSLSDPSSSSRKPHSISSVPSPSPLTR